MKEVKIVRFNPSHRVDKRETGANTSYVENTLTSLVNEGWEIVSSGGASAVALLHHSGDVDQSFFPAFVVLVRET